MTRCARQHERSLDAIIGQRHRKQFIATLKRIAAEMK
jgi:hypothetical protein